MRTLSLLFISFFFSLTFGQIKDKSVGFIENKGQIVDQKGKPNTSVKYLLNTNGLNVQIREKGFSYDVYETVKIPLTKKDKEFYTPNLSFDNKNETPDYSLKYNYHRVDIDFLNTNQNVKLIAEEKSKDYDNYYNVAHAKNGITNVHKYQKVTYQNIYNQIDVVFFIPNDSTKAVEYNFIVKPGGKVSDIQLKFNGTKTDLEDNKIKMKLRFGQMEETIPMSWTEQGNRKNEIKINYKKIKKNVYGFEGDLNSSEKTIVIDPVPIRLWGTYYGGNASEISLDVTTDNNNYVYISGLTSSNNNIATNGTHLSSILGNSNGFLAKFNPLGERIWGTYFPANLLKIKVDNNFNIYSTGNTLNPNNISTLGSHQPIKNNYNDAYLVKFNSSGLRVWATYYGGENSDLGNNIAFDNQNNVYLCGETNSNTNIATINSHQPTRGSNNQNSDGFIVKFNENGQRIWSTYYGGQGQDGLYNIFVNDDNFLYATGVSGSNSNISTPGAYQTSIFGGRDAIILKFNLDGVLSWGTYIGGENDDFLSFKGDLINNYIYLVGLTKSTTNIATTGAFVETYQFIQSQNASTAIIKFDLVNQTKVWGTYFTDVIGQLAVNSLNEVYFSGETTNNYTGITTPNAYQPIKNNYLNVFLIKLNENSQRVWGTYYSGNRATQNARIDVDNLGNIFLYGNSNGNDNGIATPNSHQNFEASNPDTFLVKFLDCLSATNANSNSPVCLGSDLELTASGGTSYSWTGPNGFTSTEQNPIIPNANTSHNGEYSCIISGTENCDNTITLNVIIGDLEAPIPTISNLPLITGDCNTIISTIPTAIDNCSGTIIGTTTNPLSYTNPGNYTITWNYDDGNGNSSSQTQNVTISSVALPSYTSPQQFCFQQNATLNDIVITGQNITWYNALTDGTVLPTNTLLLDGVTYYASQTINGCESARVPVLVTIQNSETPIGYLAQTFCANANSTLNDIVVTGQNITWYDSFVGGNIIPNTTLLQHQTTYYCTQTINGCESFRKPINIQLINTLNANNYSETICDDLNNGFKNVNLSNYNSFLISSTGNLFKYYYSLNGAQNQLVSDEVQNSSNYNLSIGNNLFYVRIESPNTCFQIVALELQLVSKPFLNIDDIMPICEGETITINAGNGFDTYLWSTNEISSSITVSQPGNYSVTVSKNHGNTTCSSTKNFTVVNSNIGTISEIITSDWTQNENTISVLLSSNSSGNYEYSLNGIDFQDNHTFYGLENGEYTVYVRDKNGCGISSEDIYLLMYPKFFTPNGDGYNDFWRIKFSENEPNLKVKIFDRYGKFLYEFNSNSAGWDGKYNSIEAPSTDYWFVVTRENGKEYKGHFSLIR